MDRKILLVADDDEMNRAVITRFLGNEFQVLEAGDGKECMELLRTKHVDALLLDIIMPEMDGLQILRLLQDMPPHPYMGILVATSAKEKTERQALALGADDVVAKPYDPIVIKKRLDNILSVKSFLREHDAVTSGDSGAGDSLRMEKCLHEVTGCVDKLHKIAKIIAYSKDNPSLIVEMAEDIHKEADRIMQAFPSGDIS